MLAKTIPIRYSSISAASSVSYESKDWLLALVSRAITGGETHAGGLNVSEYPGRTLEMFFVVLFKGESSLLEKVSGITCRVGY